MDMTRLIELATRYSTEKTDGIQTLPGISVFRREAESGIEAFIYEPVVCLILQGSKVTSIGDQSADLGPGDALLVSHDLPVASRITKASVAEPYMALILSLNLTLVRSLYEQVADVPACDVKAEPDVRSLAAGPGDASWLAPLVRYLELIDSPLDAKVLGPAIRREIHYRLLLSPIGGMLRNLLTVDSHASRIAKAIGLMREGFRSPLAVADLARTAGMSASSFHDHFRSVTGTTPLQYVKELRLIEARRMLIDESCSVSAAAYAVGYESPTHFSRDYSRKYHCPPSQDANAVVQADRRERTDRHGLVPTRSHLTV